MASNETVSELTGTAPDFLDPGVYEAQLARVEHRDTQFGERLRWVFAVPAEGDGDPVELSVWSGLKTHKKTKAGDLIEALGGQRPGKGERVDIKALVDRWCRLVVAESDDDWPKVTNVMPTKRDRVSAPPPPDEDDEDRDPWADAEVL